MQVRVYQGLGEPYLEHEVERVILMPSSVDSITLARESGRGEEGERAILYVNPDAVTALLVSGRIVSLNEDG